jgi:RND family efflux transporter MFP subunit
MPEGETGSLKRAGLIAGVVVVLAVGGGIVARSHSEHKLATWTADQSTPTVNVIHAKPSGAASQLTLPATLQALNSAAIYARTTGYVQRWNADIGQNVSRGQVLAVLDAPDVDQQLAAAQADLETARANQQLAQTTATRWKTMLTQDAVSKQETDEKVGDLAAKSALTNAARANVSRLRFQQGFTRLISPFNGVVTSRSTQIGALVVAGNASATPLFTVSDVSKIRVYVKVPQGYSAQIHPGMQVSLTLPEYANRSFPATLTRTAGAVDQSSGTVLVELQADNPDRALKPGGYAQASFPLPSASGVLSLPSSALIVGQSGTQVAVLGNDGRAQLRTITIVRDLGDTVQISGNVSASDRVIDSPPDSLQTGDRVSTLAAGNASHGS